VKRRTKGHVNKTQGQLEVVERYGTLWWR